MVLLVPHEVCTVQYVQSDPAHTEIIFDVRTSHSAPLFFMKRRSQKRKALTRVGIETTMALPVRCEYRSVPDALGAHARVLRVQAAATVLSLPAPMAAVRVAAVGYTAGSVPSFVAGVGLYGPPTHAPAPMPSYVAGVGLYQAR